jgi:hypothetical protein
MKVETSLQALFTSQTRGKLINIFFSKPREMFYVRQLVRLSGEEINSVRRELQNLKKINLLLSETRGNRLYYYPNLHHPLFSSLLTIAYKNLPSFSDLSKAEAVVASFSFLTWDKVKTDVIDVIVVGDLTLRQVESSMKSEEKRRETEFNYMVMDRSELKLRQNKRDPFLVDFFLSSPIVIIGNPAIFTQD